MKISHLHINAHQFQGFLRRAFEGKEDKLIDLM